MDPPIGILGQSFLLTPQGIRFARAAAGGFTNFVMRGFVTDTLLYATDFAVYGRVGTGSWIWLSRGALFASQTGVSLFPQQAFATAYNEYAIIPVDLRNRGRQMSVTQLNF